MEQTYIVVFVDYNKMKCGLQKIVKISNPEKNKDMEFLDKQVVWIDGLFDIGTRKQLRVNLVD